MANGKAHDSINGLMVDGYRGTLPLTMEMFPEKRWSDDQGRQWTSNIKTRLEKDNGKWYLFPTMMGGLDLPEEGAYRGALRGKHFGVYDSYDEGMKADKVIHDYFDEIKGYQSGGTVEPSSTNVHNNIDNLILKAELDRFDQTGVMRTQPENPRVTADALSRDFVEGLLPIGAGIKLFRGVPKWFKGQMIKDGKYVGGAPLKKYHFDRLNENTDYWIKQGIQDKTYLKNLPYEENLRGLWTTTSRPEAISMGGKKILEFDVPRSIIKDKGIQTSFAYPTNKEIGDIFLFPKGLPKEYFKKFHKGYQQGGVVQNLYSMI